jgi:hypothetical protein
MLWSRGGDVVGTIRYEIISSPDGVSVRIPRQSIAVDNENRLVEECLMRIATTRPYLGGIRFWFVCTCGRRVGRIYLPRGEQLFACRICHNLTYKSAQQHDQRTYDLARDPTALGAVLHAAHSRSKRQASQASLSRHRCAGAAGGMDAEARVVVTQVSAAAVALNYFVYNFIKIHRTLRTSPAMAAGVTDRLWSVEDLVALWESYELRRAERAA